MSRIVRDRLYMYLNRHHLDTRDRYTRKEKDGQSTGVGVCMRQEKSLTSGWFVGVELRTQHLVDLRPHAGLAGCQVYAICRLTYWTSVGRYHWSDTSIIFVCKPILHYIVCTTYINTVLVC